MPSLKSSSIFYALAAVALLPLSAFADSRAGGEPTLQDLTKTADSIVVGSCVNTKTAVVGSRSIETTYEVQVSEALKGKRAAGGLISITVPGGELTTPPIAMAVQGMPQLTKGEEVILFLDEKPETISATASKRRSPQSQQGKGPRVVALDSGKFTIYKDEKTGQRKVARVRMADFGFVHQDSAYRKVLRSVATGDMKMVDGQVVPLSGGVYTSPEGRDALAKVKATAPKAMAKSSNQVKGAVDSSGGIVVQNLDEFKAQIRQFAN
ncbi:hypothetical protein CVU37_07365 [candidate division BRC1 bacterium HGW-BRC1-1]|jgi:hypothetical protein|nr:MAG: hypothetical protein CVU37_07365 [candidate division BRC1 bacterium HGW-BRC1-1]